jgi:DNA repair exonuclease SbcCD ATPase subunit
MQSDAPPPRSPPGVPLPENEGESKELPEFPIESLKRHELRAEVGKLRTENKELKQEYDKAQNDMELLKGDLAQTKENHIKLNIKFQDTYASLETEVAKAKRLKTKVEELEQSGRKLERKVKIAEQDMQTLRQEKDFLQSQDEQNRQIIKDMDIELEIARKGTVKQAKQVRKAADKVFKTFESGKWMPDSDGEISAKLDTLNKDMQKWCRTYSKAKLDIDGLKPDDKARLEVILPLVTQQLDLGYLADLLKQPFASKLTPVLLTATLSNYLYHNIFDNPFFFEEGRTDPGSQSVLHRLYLSMSNGKFSDKELARRSY